MGRKTYVNAITERLMDTDNYKSTVDYAMLKYNMAQRNSNKFSIRDRTFASYLRESNLDSMSIKLRQAYNYAKKHDYIYGLPKSYISTSADEDIEITYENYLNTIEDGGVTLLKDRNTPKNLHFFAWVELYERYDYSGVDNSLGYFSVKEGTTCYLDSAILVYSPTSLEDAQLDNNIDNGGLDFSYGQSFSRERDLQRDSNQTPIEGSEDQLIMSYAFDKGNGVEYKSVTISLDHVNPEVVEAVSPTQQPNLPSGLWSLVNPNTYSKVEEPVEEDWVQIFYTKDGEVKIFKYLNDSGEIPEIDDAISSDEDIGQYFPRVYMKQNGSIMYKRGDKIGQDSKKMMKRLGLDLKETTELLIDSIDDYNNDYRDMFIHLTVSVNKDMDDQTTAKYLYNYLDRLYDLSKPQINNDINLPNSRGGIYQEIKDVAYNQTIGYAGIAKEVITGVLKNSKGTTLEAGEYVTKRAVHRSSSRQWYKSDSVHTFNHQISSTQYIKISVLRLTMQHKMYGKTIKEDGDSNQLTIPLDNAVVSRMNARDKDELINRALQVTIIHKKVVKTKWYERGVFKVLMAVVSIAMNFVVPGSGVTLMALLQAVAVTIAVSIVVNVAINILIDLAISLGLSPELVAAVTAAVVLTTFAYSGGRIDFTKVFNAKTLLKTFNFALQGYQKGIADSIMKIQEEMKEYQTGMDKKYEDLEEAQSMLITGVIPPSLEMLTDNRIDTNQLYLGETAEEFYTRAMTTDVTDIIENMVEYFYDMSTSLPRAKQPVRTKFEDVSDVLLIT